MLQVTSKKDQQQYWAHKEMPYRFITVQEFAEAFKSFHVGQKLADELQIPFDKSQSHRAALAKKVYGVGKRELLKACFSREFLLMKRNSFVYIFKLVQVSINLVLSCFSFSLSDNDCFFFSWLLDCNYRIGNYDTVLQNEDEERFSS